MSISSVSDIVKVPALCVSHLEKSRWICKNKTKQKNRKKEGREKGKISTGIDDHQGHYRALKRYEFIYMY